VPLRTKLAIATRTRNRPLKCLAAAGTAPRASALARRTSPGGRDGTHVAGRPAVMNRTEFLDALRERHLAPEIAVVLIPAHMRIPFGPEKTSSRSSAGAA